MRDDIVIEPAVIVPAALRKKIEAAVRQAWIGGMDFVHSPVTLDEPDPFAISDIFAAQRFEAEVQGGPVARGEFDPPAGWSIYRCPDMTPAERGRFAAGRSDWREGDWQDHCGDLECSQCTGDVPA